MYFPELEKLEPEYGSDIIEKIDTWLAMLPRSYKDKIIPSKLCPLGLQFKDAEKLLDKCHEIGLLNENYLIRCPECDLALKISDMKNLVDAIDSINYCYGCDSEDIKITTNNIYPVYELVKEPKSR